MSGRICHLWISSPWTIPYQIKFAPTYDTAPLCLVVGWLCIRKLVQSFDNAFIDSLQQSQKIHEISLAKILPIYQCNNLLQNVSRPEANHVSVAIIQHWHVCAGLPSCLGLFRHGHVLVICGNIVDDILVLKGQPPRRLRMNPQNQNTCRCWRSITFASSWFYRQFLVRPPPTSLSLHFQWLRPFHNRRQDRSPWLPKAQRQWTPHVQVNSPMPGRLEQGSLLYPNTWKRGNEFLITRLHWEIEREGERYDLNVLTLVFTTSKPSAEAKLGKSER